MTMKAAFVAGLLALILQLAEFRDTDVTGSPTSTRMSSSPVKIEHLKIKMESVVKEVTASDLKPLIAAYRAVQTAGSLKKSLENYRKHIEEDFTNTRDKMMARICAETQGFKDKLKSTISLAKKIGPSARRASFLDIITQASGDAEDGIQFIEGMVRHLALSDSIDKVRIRNYSAYCSARGFQRRCLQFALVPARRVRVRNGKLVTVDSSGEDGKREYAINFDDLRSFAFKKMQLYADELQIDSQSISRIINFLLKCIKEGMTALESVEFELRTNHRYPKDMDKKEKKMRRALGVGNLYREECAVTE
ncbi:uncharacterized protein [Bemisia tabaci]|uniref:uncharacterized protein isoform X1 n=1 Tax=Bemisia tabaci TaxID=7038 RepID=UPI003B281CC9